MRTLTTTLTVALFTALLGCSTDGDAGEDAGPGYLLTDVSSPEDPPWPDAADTSVPSCTPWSDAWSLPDMKVDEGDLALTASGAMQPIGVDEEVLVVATAPGGGPDPQSAGALSVDGGAGVKVVSAPAMVAGQARVVVQVLSEGAHTLSVTLADGRVGRVGLYGYTSQLPIWRVDVDRAAFDAMVSKPLERIWVDATAVVDGKLFPGRMRLHGGSSRTFPKKSLRLNLDKHPALPGGRRKIVLRAEYADKAMVRNHLAYTLLRRLTWLPASETRYVHLRVGPRFHGVMVLTERVDKDFLTARGLSPEGSLYEADPPFELSVPGGNLTPVEDPQTYRLLYQRHAGELAYADLIELIEVVLQLPDATFAEQADRIIKVDDVLAFLAFNAVIQNQDFVKKNYYLYRDPQIDDSRWTVIPWDLDLSLGHLWTPEGDVLDEQIFTDGSPHIGRNTGTLFYNQLVERILGVPKYRARLRVFIQHMLDHGFDTEPVRQLVRQAHCAMQPDLLADRDKRADNDELEQRATEVIDYVTARRAWLKSWLAEPGD